MVKLCSQASTRCHKSFVSASRGKLEHRVNSITFVALPLFLLREIFLAIDGIDELFDHPHFREDTDLTWRALQYGEIPYAPDVRVYHPPQVVSAKEGFDSGYQYEKDAILMHRHPERYRTLFFRECHYINNRLFQRVFLYGAEKYGVQIDETLLLFDRARA